METDKGAVGGEGGFENPIQFLRGSAAELKKVHHPTRAETVQATIITLLIMMVVSIGLFLMDFFFKSLMSWLLNVR